MEGLRELRVIAQIWIFWVRHHKCIGFREVRYKGAKGDMYGLFCKTHMNGVAL